MGLVLEVLLGKCIEIGYEGTAGVEKGEHLCRWLWYLKLAQFVVVCTHRVPLSMVTLYPAHVG